MAIANDRIERRSFAISTALHAALLALALWRVSELPPPTASPAETEPESAAESPPQQRAAPLILPPPQAQGPGADTPADLPPLPTGPLPPLAPAELLGDAIHPHNHPQQAERRSRGEGEDLGTGAELPLALSVGSLVEELTHAARDADKSVDRELRQWQEAAAVFNILVDEQWRRAWRPRFRARVQRPRLRIWVELDEQQRVVSAQIIAGHGSGVDELDRLIEIWIGERYRSGDALALSPIRSPLRRQPFVVDLQ